MNERKKLNISFRNLKDIEQIQYNKNYKISVRNNLGIKQNDDWIYNLNIGNVMHLSLMGTEELAPINRKGEDSDATNQTMIHKSDKEAS